MMNTKAMQMLYTSSESRVNLQARRILPSRDYDLRYKNDKEGNAGSTCIGVAFNTNDVYMLATSTR